MGHIIAQQTAAQGQQQQQQGAGGGQPEQGRAGTGRQVAGHTSSRQGIAVKKLTMDHTKLEQKDKQTVFKTPVEGPNGKPIQEVYDGKLDPQVLV